MRDRLKQRSYNVERTIPLQFKTLPDILNPQPVATIAVKHLLSWIDRVDDAAQRGLPRPPFKTLGGGESFPEEAWRSIDIASRAKGPDAGDEDGPFLWP